MLSGIPEIGLNPKPSTLNLERDEGRPRELTLGIGTSLMSPQLGKLVSLLSGNPLTSLAQCVQQNRIQTARRRRSTLEGPGRVDAARTTMPGLGKVLIRLKGYEM